MVQVKFPGLYISINSGGIVINEEMMIGGRMKDHLSPGLFRRVSFHPKWTMSQSISFYKRCPRYKIGFN
jgi:hypothetical protein